MSFFKRFFGSPSQPTPPTFSVTPSGPQPERKGTQGEDLLKAAGAGNADQIKLLLDAGVDKDARDKDGRTALHIGAGSGHTRVVSTLLASGANVDARTADGWTPLYYAATNGHAEIISMLLANHADKDAKTTDGETSLQTAAGMGLGAVVALLLEAGANGDVRDKDGKTALHNAAAFGHDAVVTALLTKGANIEEKVEAKGALEGMTPLHFATFGGHSQVVSRLLAAGARVDAKTADGRTPLHFAAAEGHVAMVKMFLAHGAEKSVVALRNTPLTIARTRGHTAVVEILEATESVLPRPPAVKIFEKKDNETFAEVKGDLSAVPVLFATAEPLYQKVMAASRSGRLLPEDESSLITCADFLSKLVELDSTRGEPFAMRAAMYFVRAQVNRDKSYLDKAESDYLKAIQVGSSDPSNLAIWYESIEQVHAVRRMI